MRAEQKQSRRGFQLIELMVAMVALGIFAVAASSMLVFIWRGWVNNAQSVQMQRDVSIAMRAMAREIRRTPLDDITPGTSSLTCYNAHTATATVFSKSGDRLNMQSDDGTGTTLISDYVRSFTTSTNANGSVTINLKLAAPRDSSSSSMVVYSRN